MPKSTPLFVGLDAADVTITARVQAGRSWWTSPRHCRRAPKSHYCRSTPATGSTRLTAPHCTPLSRRPTPTSAAGRLVDATEVLRELRPR